MSFLDELIYIYIYLILNRKVLCNVTMYACVMYVYYGNIFLGIHVSSLCPFGGWDSMIQQESVGELRVSI